MATSSAPFVPRDVFRLLVRLEAQKTHDVDSATLERRFRVPVGYAKDETLEQRERKAHTITPGPGAYKTPQCWASAPLDASRPRASAVFASRAARDPFQLAPVAKPTAVSPRAASVNGREDEKRTKSVLVASVLSVPPPLGSFARADRGMLSTPTPLALPLDAVSQNHRQSIVTAGVSFERAPRATHVETVPPCALGPAQYAVQRLWEPSRATGRATPDAPTPAVFSASKEKREVVWSPARALPSYAVADAWNSSLHYAKHKRRVVRELHERRPQQQRQQQSLQRLAASASSPSLGLRRARENADSTHALLDPFDWLRRQQPQGEQRVNVLAVKHGLVDLVRPLTAAATAAPECPDHVAVGNDHNSKSLAVGATSLGEDDEDDHATGDASSRSPRHSSITTTSARDDRICISCRLQGGLVVSVRLYAAKTVRQLKTAFVRKQTRYASEDQFELYLANGKPLVELDETLAQAGVRDKTLLQVVSRP